VWTCHPVTVTLSSTLSHPFLQDLEVTVTLSDKPELFGGSKAEEVVASAASTSRSEAGGVTTITSFRPSHHSSSTGVEEEAPAADLSAMLPVDEALVYGGDHPHEGWAACAVSANTCTCV